MKNLFLVVALMMLSISATFANDTDTVVCIDITTDRDVLVWWYRCQPKLASEIAVFAVDRADSVTKIVIPSVMNSYHYKEFFKEFFVGFEEEGVFYRSRTVAPTYRIQVCKGDTIHLEKILVGNWEGDGVDDNSKFYAEAEGIYRISIDGVKFEIAYTAKVELNIYISEIDFKKRSVKVNVNIPGSGYWMINGEIRYTEGHIPLNKELNVLQYHHFSGGCKTTASKTIIVK